MALTTYQPITLTGGAANTKGAYVQIVASTPFASSRLFLILRSVDVARRWVLLDLATGAGGAETVLVANVALQSDGDTVIGDVVPLDVDIPAGTRLAARCQSSAIGNVVTAALLLEDRALGSLTAPVTYGATPSTSQGTVVDPGTTVDTKGSYVALTASTLARIDALALCVTGGSFTASAFTSWSLDVATGGAGSETIVIADLLRSAGSLADTPRPGVLRLPVSIPAGTRLAVRCACNRNTAGERLLAVTAIGMQEPAPGGGAVEHAYTFVGMPL